MARKNVFDARDDRSGPVAEEAGPVASRPLAGLARPVRSAAPLGAISQSLDGISARVRRAEDIERALAQGQAVVELDPSLVDASIVPDRMEGSQEEHEVFVEAIRSNGQQVPILVRPKPGSPERYEVAYGHRRLRAARDLGRPVRAVVRTLSDDDLVVAQGQENNARTDLTFIERARFAARLEDRSFRRETIMSALNVDKAALSRLIAIAVRVPQDVAEAVGPARSIGRIKWNELADLLDTGGLRYARQRIDTEDFRSAMSDRRFELLLAALTSRDPGERREPPKQWTADDGTKIAKVVKTGRGLTLAFDERAAPSFGEFVKSRLQVLYSEYQAERQNGA